MNDTPRNWEAFTAFTREWAVRRQSNQQALTLWTTLAVTPSGIVRAGPNETDIDPIDKRFPVAHPGISIATMYADVQAHHPECLERIGQPVVTAEPI